MEMRDLWDNGWTLAMIIALLGGGVARPSQGRTRMKRTASLAVLIVNLLAPAAVAEERLGVDLSGASGGAKYAEDMKKWRSGTWSALVDRYGFAKDKVRVFVDETDKTGEQGTAANVRAALTEVKKQLTRDDVLLIDPVRAWHVRRPGGEIQSGRPRSHRRRLEVASHRDGRQARRS